MAQITSCPRCGEVLVKWYEPDWSNEGDVAPRAECQNGTCSWGY